MALSPSNSMFAVILRVICPHQRSYVPYVILLVFSPKSLDKTSSQLRYDSSLFDSILPVLLYIPLILLPRFRSLSSCIPSSSALHMPIMMWRYSLFERDKCSVCIFIIDEISDTLICGQSLDLIVFSCLFYSCSIVPHFTTDIWARLRSLFPASRCSKGFLFYDISKDFCVFCICVIIEIVDHPAVHLCFTSSSILWLYCLLQ